MHPYVMSSMIITSRSKENNPSKNSYTHLEIFEIHLVTADYFDFCQLRDSNGTGKGVDG